MAIVWLTALVVGGQGRQLNVFLSQLSSVWTVQWNINVILVIGKDVFSDWWICNMKMTCTFFCFRLRFQHGGKFMLNSSQAGWRIGNRHGCAAMHLLNCYCMLPWSNKEITVFFLPYIGFITFNLFILIILWVVFSHWNYHE